MQTQTKITPFTKEHTVHPDELNMEKNTYWTEYPLWFIKLLGESLNSITPGLKERLRSEEVKTPLFDIYIKHVLPTFMYDNLSVSLELDEINHNDSSVKSSVVFERGEEKIAEGWQRIVFKNAEGHLIAVPDEIAKTVKTVNIIDKNSSDLVIDKNPGKKTFTCIKTVYLHHTNNEGLTSPMVYLNWFGETREAFLLEIMPGFNEQFASGLRILTHDTYLRNYSVGASFNETVSVGISVGEMRSTSAKLLFTFKKADKTLARGWQTVVFFSSQRGKPIRIPVHVLKNSAPYAAKGLNVFKFFSKIEQ
ncbi:MAG: hypothetical protein ABIA08_02860 [bacterium]